MKEQKNMYQVEWNEMLQERWELCMERIHHIPEENIVAEEVKDFFVKEATFIMQIEELVEKKQTGELEKYSLEELQALNQSLYQEILPENYDTCYGNPTYTVEKFGEEMGQLLAFLYAELRGLIVYAYENRRYDILIYSELFLEIYQYFCDGTEDVYGQSKSAIYYFFHDYCDYLAGYRVSEMIDPSLSFAYDIIMNSDLTKPNYLYQFGEYITENEIEVANYLASLPEERIEAMAKTYTEGFRLGFEHNKIDLSKKSIVNIRYSVGFERMVKAAVRQFEAMGLRSVFYRTSVSSMSKRQHLKIGYFSSSPNRQFDYDHRFDEGLYLNKAIITKKLQMQRQAYENLKECARAFAGPAVIETFGEIPFTPVSKAEAIQLNEKQQELNRDYQRDSALLVNEFIPRDEYSFTIIAYPVPEIGEKFEEIFDETVKVNTLDMDQYRQIQQAMINALDQGEGVHIVGKGANKTDLVVKLQELQNPEKETKFENCLADVNIPVGEVFTSPKLAGTNGHFHVTEVFLNDLKYIDLELTFVDGMITEYTCKNFDSEEENKKFVKENLMYQRDTLPMGEFAIGTNTTAYKMARTYQIAHLLPILIAEKTGPHFAVGDTCFKMSEEIKVYNPDGKEMIARDNACSILRKTDIANAYFNCHTDITIPYDELGKIAVVTKEGNEILIIENGRFVLPGTEELNRALD